MSAAEAKTAVAEMPAGALQTLFESGISPEEVMGLVPVKLLGEKEQVIRSMYRSRLYPSMTS